MANATERRLAARRLFEGSNADPDLIAACLGMGRASLDAIARREAWRPREEGLESTIDRLMDQLSAQLRLFETQAEAAEGLSKTQLDALLAITRTFDRLGEMKRAEEARRASGPSEHEIGAARAAIEQRIGQLGEQRATTIIAVMGGADTQTKTNDMDEGDDA